MRITYQKIFLIFVVIFINNGNTIAQNRNNLKQANPSQKPQSNQYLWRIVNDSVFNKHTYSKVEFARCLFPKSVSFSFDKVLGNVDFGTSVFLRGGSFSEDTFMGNAEFGNIIFSKYAIASPGIIGVSFDGSTFNKEANFSGTNFYVPTMFNLSKFLQNSYFMSSVFHAGADFHDTKFIKDVNFSDAAFKGEVGFRNTVFSGNTTFSGVTFSSGIGDPFDKQSGERVTFSSASFLKTADFSNATFSNYVFFQDTKFSNVAAFNNMHVKDSTLFSFNGAILPDTLCFENIQFIKNDIDLTAADFRDSVVPYFQKGEVLNKWPLTLRFKDSVIAHSKFKRNRKCNIFLFNVDISKFHIDYIHFKLLFTDPSPSGHYIIPTDEREGIYESLLKNFKDRGQNESYKLLDIEYREFKWSIAPIYIRWWGFLDKWWWNYGYNKEWVFLWAIGFLFLFSIITFTKINYLNKEVYVIENIPFISSVSTGRRIWYSIIYTCSLFFRLTLKLDKIKYTHILWTIYIFIVYLSGIICIAYMANFVLQR